MAGHSVAYSEPANEEVWDDLTTLRGRSRRQERAIADLRAEVTSLKALTTNLTAAVAALTDQDWLHGVVARVATGRERLASIAGDCGLNSVPSATNFVAIDCGGDGDFAMRVLKALEARGVFVRKPMAPGLDRCIRVSVGPAAELDVFAAELPLALREAG